jgi:serine phosphatase RsbU (regulator of sigma subunit)/Tfp pilus assembly protein PilF
MKNSCFFFFLLLLSTSLFAQDAESSHMIDSLRKVLSGTIHDTTRAKTLVETGENFYDISPDSSLAYWKLSETFCLQALKKQTGEKEQYCLKSYLARAYNNIAYFYQRNSLKTAEAFTWYEKALEIEEKIGNVKEQGKTLNNLATLYSNIGDIENCISYHHKALKAREKAGYTAGIIISLNNLTAIYFQQGELEKAMEYSKKAELIAESQSSFEDLTYIYSNRASILLSRGDTLNSEMYYRKALKFAIQSGMESNYCEAYIRLAGFFIACNQADSAIMILNKALPIATRLKINYSIINIHQFLGKAYLQKKKAEEAKKNILIALELAQKINRRSEVAVCSELLSNIYEKDGNAIKALEMYKLFVTIRDSSFNEISRKKTIREQLQYDYEKKAAADSLHMLAEKKITEVKLKQEKTQRYGLYGGILLLLAFAGFVFHRFRESQKQKHLIEEKNRETEVQKKIIEEKQAEILSSFNYAQRIQYSLLANETQLTGYFKDCFVLFRPKDIVSGDFYWAAHKGDCFYLAVCDSTGHGVPGAFMSLLSIGFLSEAIKERNINEPNLVFDYVRQRLEESMSKEENRDGFDGVLIAINEKTRIITYAAANNGPLIVKDGQAIKLPCDKMPVGKYEKHTPFTLFSLDYKDAAMIYFCTDGYADQFGGPKGKKFKYKNLERLIVDNHNKPMQEQLTVLNKTFDAWKSWPAADGSKQEIEQTDDVTVIGLHLHD